MGQTHTHTHIHTHVEFSLELQHCCYAQFFTLIVECYKLISKWLLLNFLTTKVVTNPMCSCYHISAECNVMFIFRDVYYCTSALCGCDEKKWRKIDMILQEYFMWYNGNNVQLYFIEMNPRFFISRATKEREK